MGRKRKGAFTLYFGVIFMSVLLIGLSVLDFARMNVYKVQAQRAMEITANSLITKYDKSFQDNYGLFMAPSEKLQERANFLLKENFQAGSLGSADKKISAVDMNASEIKEQILEYMKFRGPLIAVSKIYSMFSSFKSITSSGDKFTDRVDTELSGSDFLDALNEYRYYVHGWTFLDDAPDYKYIAQNPKDANGYFVRSLIDFAAENPYAPNINMKDRNLFHDALADLDLDNYAAHFQKNWLKADKIHVWNAGLDEMTEIFDMPALVCAHDWELAGFYEVLEDKKKAGEEGLDDKLDILKELGIHEAYPVLANMLSLSRFDYEEYGGTDEILSLMKLLKYYAEYYEAQTEEEKAQPTTPIDTELMTTLNYLNVGLNKDARWLETCYRLTERNYKILQGLKASNIKARDELVNVAKYLNDYEAQVRKEKDNLAGSQEKDANYVARTEPMLEDKLEMIALMREKLQKVQAEAKFDYNIEVLDDMIALLCVPACPEYGGIDYYELTAGDLEQVTLQNMPNYLGKKKSMSPLLVQRDDLIKKIRGKRPETWFPPEVFDEDVQKDFQDARQKYLANCQSMHIDFTKEQLFARVGESVENAKKGSEKASGSFGKILGIAKQFFSDLFSFGSDKELSKKEFKALPSQARFSKADDTEAPDEEALGSNTGSSKGNKKAAKSSKSWLSAIKNIVESFKRLTDDPLGTIYVNEYIMTAFRSSVTGKGEYSSQINLRFQDKNENPKAEDLKLESEIEYIIAGERTDKDNNKDIALKIMGLRVLPNLLYVFTDPETTGLASALATAITAIFPPIYPLVYVVICVLWAIAESVVDVFILRLGQKVAFLKCSGEFMLAPSGVATLLKTVAEAAISSAANAAQKAVQNGANAVDDYITEKVKGLEEHAKEYIDKQVNKMTDAIGDKLKVKEVEEFVTSKYHAVESAVSDLEKSLDNYVEAVVGKYLVYVEKARAQAEKLGNSKWVQKVDKGFISKLMNTEVALGIKTAAEGNLGSKLMDIVNEKLANALNEQDMPSAAQILKAIKQDGGIKSLLDEKKAELRKKMEEKLDELVFDPINQEINEQKEKVKEDVTGYLNTKIEQGAEGVQKYYNDNVQSVLSEAIGSGDGKVSTTEKASSGFKLGYEDYLRMYLIFIEEDDKMFRILDLVQLREGKQLSEYMAGVRIEIGFNVPYLFLPRLIQIAKKQSSAITVKESDYERVDFRLRTVAGY